MTCCIDCLDLTLRPNAQFGGLVVPDFEILLPNEEIHERTRNESFSRARFV
jgi:hypothetical protein